MDKEVLAIGIARVAMAVIEGVCENEELELGTPDKEELEKQTDMMVLQKLQKLGEEK